MRSFLLALLAAAALAPAALAADDFPPVEAFQVFEQTAATGTAHHSLSAIPGRAGMETGRPAAGGVGAIRMRKICCECRMNLRKKLLEMIGGLPAEKTELHARITGKIEMDGFTIEKLIFESLPGVYVTRWFTCPTIIRKKVPRCWFPRATRRTEKFIIRNGANGWQNADMWCWRGIPWGRENAASSGTRRRRRVATT